MMISFRYPEYWAEVASKKTGMVTWLKAVSKVEPAFLEKSFGEWASEWVRELLEATMFYAKAGKVDVVKQLSVCHENKAEHMRSARRWFDKAKKAEAESKTADVMKAEAESTTADVGDHVVRGIEILQSVGKAFPKSTTPLDTKRTIRSPRTHRAKRRRKSFKVLDSEGNAVPPLVIKTPPSSPDARARVSSAARSPGAPRMSFAVATAEKIERRMLSACQDTVDTIVAAHLPSLQTKDFGTRVHEIRKSLRSQMQSFNQDPLEWDSNMDLFADIRNVHAHVRPHWQTDWAVLSGVIKTHCAVAKFRNPDSIKKVGDHVLFVLATLRKHNPGPLPSGIQAVKPQHEIKELGDIPTAPVKSVFNVLGPLLSNAEAELQAHVQRNALYLRRIFTRDSMDTICAKLITVQRQQSATCPGVPDNKLPIQSCFPGLREGGKISTLARWLRVLLRALLKFSSGESVRIECAVPLAVAVRELLVTIGQNPLVAEDALDGLLAIYLAKGNLVSLSRDGDELASDLKGDESEPYTSDRDH